MRISENCIKLVKKWEGCRLKAYQDEVGVWTIGYGITNADKSITGCKITKGMTINQATADSWLEKALTKIYLPKVEKYQAKYNWNQNQIDALVSFAYNIGSIDTLTAHGTRSNSVISNKILEYNKAGGVKYLGLVNRRKEERALFIKPYGKKPYSGILPVLPDESFGITRKYYQYNDGVKTLKNYPTQIKRLQDTLKWAGYHIADKEYGKYLETTRDAVKSLQKDNGLPINGMYGIKCLTTIKNMKR